MVNDKVKRNLVTSPSMDLKTCFVENTFSVDVRHFFFQVTAYSNSLTEGKIRLNSVLSKSDHLFLNYLEQPDKNL